MIGVGLTSLLMNPLGDLAMQPGQVGEQVELFSVEQLDNQRISQGFRGPAVCRIVGITYRQLDYWARTDLVGPSLRAASGSGSQRSYSFADLVTLKVVKRLLDAGVSLQNIRVAVEHLRARGVRDLAQITLISDGVSIYECQGPDDIGDLLRGGQGVFGIALGVTMRDILGRIDADPALTQSSGPSATIVGLPRRPTESGTRFAG
jgi:DNA-binding transcriptional MerR regulator